MHVLWYLSLCRESGQNDYSSAIISNLTKSEVTGAVNDLHILIFAVSELLLSATYLAGEKGR